MLGTAENPAAAELPVVRRANPRKGGVVMANTFDWIEIRTRDIETTATFYESLFGWKVTEKETADGFDVWVFDTGGVSRVSRTFKEEGYG